MAPPLAPPPPPPPYEVCQSLGPGIYRKDCTGPRCTPTNHAHWPTMCGPASTIGHCMNEVASPAERVHVIVCSMWKVQAPSASAYSIDMTWPPMFARVGAGADVLIEVFDSATIVGNDLDLRGSILPTLVADAEAGARINVRVHDSAKADVTTRLAVSAGAALIDRLVVAREGVTVDVTITNSGNVEAGAGASLTWDNAALIHTLVTIGGGAAAPSGTTAGDATRIVTNVTASANVRMSGTAEGSLTFLNNGSVISPLVDISTADAEVDVSTHDLGNVFTPNARLVMDTAYVLAGHVRVAMHPHAQWSCARAAVNVRSAVGGQVTALSLDMERASIVEETIDVKIEHDMCTHLNVSAELTSVASLTVSEHVFFENSQLLDETVDVDLHQHSMGEGLHANVVVSLDDTANAYMSGTADMRVYNSSELIGKRRRLEPRLRGGSWHPLHRSDSLY